MRKIKIVARYRRAREEDDWTIIYPVLTGVLFIVLVYVSIAVGLA